ncbi:MAG: nuclear transport factor 2 family protein [Acidobacteriia bacterium]|nr:nuclear transport factor 2 family protein [Terriglobia bacterium]
MPKRLSTILTCILAISLTASAQKKSAKMASGPMPDKALMQKIWDGWSTLNPDNTAKFYAKGEHTFFDIAPLKYNNWEEYDHGVRNVLADVKAATCTVNDDAQIHPAGEYVWGTATVKSDMTETSGKRDLSTFRWTVIWGKQDGKWLIVHEHVSEPIH